MLFLNQLQHNCSIYSEKTAIEFIHPDRREIVTYGQLEAAVQKTMAYLQSRGLQPGDRVALQLPKSLPFIYLHLAIMRLNAISLPLNPAYPLHELNYFLNDSGATLFFADAHDKEKLESSAAERPTLATTIYLSDSRPQQFEALLADVVLHDAELPPLPNDGDATALMIYTSGTTGQPKGAEITHRNLTTNIEALHQAWGWQENDVLLHVLPLFHVHGLSVALHGALHAAASTIMLLRFDPQLTLKTLVERRCTMFMAVPTMHKRLVDCPDAASYDLSHMRLVTSGSDRLPDELFSRFRELFGHTLLERYGMTETGMNLSNPLHGERRVGSVGLPLPGVEARIIDPESGEILPDGAVGEVHIRGAHVFKGYWKRPDKTAESFTPDGWFKTGDLGLREADGYYTLKGRAKDLIITGGLNVYPPEVELVLADHPSVAASAVIGCPDTEWGEQVVAVIVAKPDQPAAEDTIIAYCREHLASYKAPKKVLFVDDLPRNTLGKVQTAQLRQLLCR